MADCLVGAFAARECFATLISPHVSALFETANALSGDSAAGQELLLDTLDRALRRFARGPVPGDLRLWLFGQLAATYRSPLRHVAGWLRRAMHYGPSESLPLPLATTRREAAQAQEALLGLPRHLRAALVLRDVSGFSYAQMAEILRWPHRLVAQRVAAGRRRLVRLLWANGHCALG